MSTISRCFRHVPVGWAVLLALVSGVSASAQTPSGPAPPIQGVTTTIPGLTLADTITQMTRPVGALHVGEALGLATELAVGTTPFGASSGGFVIKLDPVTGLQVRTATTFGPSFAERALTSGEGNVSVGVNYMSSGFDRLDSQSFNGLQLRSATGVSPANGRSGVANITLTANTVVVAARMGVSDNLDVGVDLPIVTVKVSGTTQLMDGNGKIFTFTRGSGAASGLGDVTALVKYRFYSFGTGQPDPGGLAVMGTMRLPTGDAQNLRGLGVTRTLISLIASSGQRRFRPHANGGFEYWSKGVGVISDAAPNSTVEARNQVQYAAGFEFEAAPKATLLLDLIGGEILGGGKLGFQADTSTAPGVTSSGSIVALPDGISKISLVPGIKVNLKGKMLLSLNALIALHDTGLHARVTTVAGINLTF
jgi:hypothetical protein